MIRGRTTTVSPGPGFRTSRSPRRCSSRPPPPLYPDGRTAFERFAFGGYAGFGFGARPWPWVEVYLRGRVQLTRATHVPTTLWGSALGGVQFKIGPVDVGAGVGWACYFNDRDQNNGFALELGVTVPFRVHAP